MSPTRQSFFAQLHNQSIISLNQYRAAMGIRVEGEDEDDENANPSSRGHAVGAKGGTLAECPYDIGSPEEKDWTYGHIEGTAFSHRIKGTMDHTPEFYHDLAEREGRLEKPMTIRRGDGRVTEIEDPDATEPVEIEEIDEWPSFTGYITRLGVKTGGSPNGIYVTMKFDDDAWKLYRDRFQQLIYSGPIQYASLGYQGLSPLYSVVDEVEPEPDPDEPAETLMDRIRDTLIARADTGDDKVHISVSTARPALRAPKVNIGHAQWWGKSLQDQIAHINNLIWVPKHIRPKNDW